MNTFWRAFLDDGRFIALTRVVFVSANKRDGSVLIAPSGNADLNLAFLEDPGDIPPTNLANFAWEMCCAAVQQKRARAWLKAAKRAYNYFSTIGDIEHMRALEPAFVTPEARAEQYATVIDGISITLDPTDMRVRQPSTRILTVSEARDQVEDVARIVETTFPNRSAARDGAAIAADLRARAAELRARNARGQLEFDRELSDEFDKLAKEIRRHIHAGVQPIVEPVIVNHVEPVCPNEADCDRRRRRAPAPPAAPVPAGP
jgi:hypothetical protein